MQQQYYEGDHFVFRVMDDAGWVGAVFRISLAAAPPILVGLVLWGLAS